MGLRSWSLMILKKWPCVSGRGGGCGEALHLLRPGRLDASILRHVAQRPEFVHLSPCHQFALLVGGTSRRSTPAKPPSCPDSTAATQRALLGWLADVTRQKPAAREVELWRVRKGERELRCVAVYLPTGIDLRLLERDGFRRTELVRDAPALGVTPLLVKNCTLRR